MPKAAAVSEEQIKDIDEGSSGNKEYLAQRRRIFEHFTKYVKDVENCDLPIEDMVKDTENLGSYVKRFFYGAKVDKVKIDKKTGKKIKVGEMEPPSLGYAKSMKTCLFGVFAKEYKVS